jgi:signal transduction histidine kinase
MLETTLNIFSATAHLNGIGLTLKVDSEVPTLLNGDPGRLRQVVCNLISNALKFTKRGHVSVDLRVGQLHES